jgi:hypothetical protein
MKLHYPIRTLFVTALLTIPTLPSAAQFLAGPIHNPTNGHDYYLTVQTIWTVAEADAISIGGHLTTINDATENWWVFNNFSSYGGINRNLWVGLTDTQQSGQFTWVSGEPTTYLNWASPEPNYIGDEHYVYMYCGGLPYPREAGSWNNYTDDSNLGGGWGGGSLGPVCGVVEIVPEPTSLGLAVLGLVTSLCMRHRGQIMRMQRSQR